LAVHDSRFTSAGEAPWQFFAKPDSAADGKMDLMTVLMHELGHVMGLGHVSSAVDGTRLMAGSIDPGIRRLPSTLDLGPEPSTVSDHSTFNIEHSPLEVWAPYLAHYTSTNHSPLTIHHGCRLSQAPSVTTPSTPQRTVMPVIDWTEIDEHDSRSKKSALGASAQKASWLQRFLLHMGTDDATHHDHGIEVVLPGKKK
jgi:hypothetical protein